MKEVNRETLLNKIGSLELMKEIGAISLNGEYTLAAYKMLLATMEAEPVAWAKIGDGEQPINLTQNRELAYSWRKNGYKALPLYAAPQPAPVVPECFVRFHAIIKERHYGRMPEEVRNAFDECATMLNQK